MGIYFDQLTPEQIAEVWNGMGSEYFSYKPPLFCFKAASERHDFGSVRGGSEWVRWEIDFRFLRDCFGAIWKNKQYYLYPVALIYYLALVVFHPFSFNYGPKAQTWEEMEERIKADRDWLASNPNPGVKALLKKFIDQFFHRRGFLPA